MLLDFIYDCKSGNIRGALIFAKFSKHKFKNLRKYLQYFVCTFRTCRSCVLTMCVDAMGNILEQGVRPALFFSLFAAMAAVLVHCKYIIE